MGNRPSQHTTNALPEIGGKLGWNTDSDVGSRLALRLRVRSGLVLRGHEAAIYGLEDGGKLSLNEGQDIGTGRGDASVNGILVPAKEGLELYVVEVDCALLGDKS